MRVLLFDGVAGVSGDMFAGALLDLGADFSFVRESVLSLGIDGLDVTARKVSKGGIAATSFRVIDVRTGQDADYLQEHGHPHRSLSTILELLGSSKADSGVKGHAAEIFRRLGEVEANIHSVPVEEVRFHELGALDTIADVVAGCAAFLSLGAKRAYLAPLALGSGKIRTSHGILPVPAPATLALVKNYNVILSLYEGEETGELTTPTGAALATHFSSPLKAPLEMKVEGIGYGAGKKELSFPNVFRATIGTK
ncbi:LarC family nickel insertion protein [bacterium]|nr:MAG: LarC family nickel insertion protein [bacterium]